MPVCLIDWLHQVVTIIEGLTSLSLPTCQLWPGHTRSSTEPIVWGNPDTRRPSHATCLPRCGTDHADWRCSETWQGWAASWPGEIIQQSRRRMCLKNYILKKKLIRIWMLHSFPWTYTKILRIKCCGMCRETIRIFSKLRIIWEDNLNYFKRQK